MHHFGPHDIYVSPSGNDTWSGRLSEPNEDGTDGPLATLDVARCLVRERRAKARIAGPLTVWFRDGVYPVGKPVVFQPEDSAPVTYAAYPDETPVFDGSIKIDAWQSRTVNGTAAWVSDVSEILDKFGDFRQLFVNGVRRPRPRLPKEGYYWVEDVPGLPPKGVADDRILIPTQSRFIAAEGDIQPWKNLQDVDILVNHLWTEQRLPIASYDPETRMVTSSRKSTHALRDDGGARYAKYQVENVFEALTEPGEWYLDKTERKLYYVPMPGETPETTDVSAPVLLQFIRIEGRPMQERYVEFVGFRGLTFRYSDWLQPKYVGRRFNPYADESPRNDTANLMDGKPTERIAYASGGQAASYVPGAITMEGARNCSIEDCTIEHIGWYGVELADGCWGNRIVGNTISDMGGGGVKVDGAATVERRLAATSNNRITDNHIHHGGEIFGSACGIAIMNAASNLVAHNHIHDLYYTGISCGWTWGYGESAARENRIEKNHIHDLGKGVLSDMGGVYLLGVQPGTVVAGNLVHDIQKANYGGWAIYPDEGSSHIVIENNISYNTSSQPFHQHYGRDNVVRNNIWAFGAEGLAALSRGNEFNRRYTRPGQNIRNAVTFERNIFITDGEPIFVGALADVSGNLENGDFISDLNLFFDVSGQAIVSGNGRHGKHGRENLTRAFDWTQWQALGFDRHSIVADPKCRDLARRDFALAADSPALALGFKPIDLSDVGVRPPELRSDEPAFQERRWDV